MKLFVAATLALFATAPAWAAPVKIDFEGAPGYVNAIGNFYNGGSDSLGQSGPNFGVAFTSSVLGLSNDVLGPYYGNAPSPLTVIFAEDSSAFMNVALGFSGSLSLAYASTQAVSAGVKVYSGLNGSGNLLGSLNLAANASSGCSSSAYCRFDVASLAFAGTARSVSLGGGAPNVLFDDIHINTVPTPATSWLVMAGLFGVAATARRRSA